MAVSPENSAPPHNRGSRLSETAIETATASRNSATLALRSSLKWGGLFSDGPPSGHLSEDVLRATNDDPRTKWCGNRLVVTEANIYRSFWNLVLAVLLLYTATVMPYTLCFLDFRLNAVANISFGLKVVRKIIDILFWVDLIINFFFSYTDANGKEILELRRTTTHYLSGWFGLNLVACIPDEVFESMTSGSEGGLSSLTRLTRVQRLGRLGRLLRLVRLVKVFAFLKERSWFLWLKRLRGVRMLNLCVILLWVNHLVACGWYLCAAIHNDSAVTWVATRILPDGDSLIDKGPFDQWLQSMYFVLTVFSTVGFGDIAAFTSGEIIYVVFIMLLGMVVHGTVMSEIINVVTEMDDKALEHSKQKTLVKAFVQHTELNDEMSKALNRWLDPTGKTRKLQYSYDRQAMKKILASGALPYTLMEQMQHIVFGGELMANKFVGHCTMRSPSGRLPPRFPIILSLAMIRQEYHSGEIVFQLHDHPCSCFLVLNGVFACVGIPTPTGGVDSLLTPELQSVSSKKNPWAGGDGMTRTMSQAEGGNEMQRKDNYKLFLLRNATGGKFGKQRDTGVEPVADVSAGQKTEEAYPYHFYPYGTYFGDHEIVGAANSRYGTYSSRNCSIRCESETGSVLVISRQDLMQTMTDFPQFAEVWLVAGRQNERRRVVALSTHTCGITYRHLAACKIQAAWKYQADDNAAERRKNRAEQQCQILKEGYAFLARHGLDEPRPESPELEDDVFFPKTLAIPSGGATSPEHSCGTASITLPGEPLPAAAAPRELIPPESDWREAVQGLRKELKEIKHSLADVRGVKASIEELRHAILGGSPIGGGAMGAGSMGGHYDDYGDRVPDRQSSHGSHRVPGYTSEGTISPHIPTPPRRNSIRMPAASGGGPAWSLRSAANHSAANYATH